jgi:HNH endonuclease
MLRVSRKRVTKLPYVRWRWTADQRLQHYTKRDPVSGCLIWQGSLAHGGYGQLHFRSQSYLAHRLAWILKHGPIPPGLNVCHRCDERRCVNPDHLFLGSHSVNMTDLRMKTRSWYVTRPEPRSTKSQWDAGMAPIRIRYRGIEFVGKAAIRVVDPNAGLPYPLQVTKRATPAPAARPAPAPARRPGRRGTRDGQSARRSGDRS